MSADLLAPIRPPRFLVHHGEQTAHQHGLRFAVQQVDLPPLYDTEVALIEAPGLPQTAHLLAQHIVSALEHERLLARRYGQRVVPFVLITLGALILYEAGSLDLIR